MPTLAVGIDARQATIGGRIAARAITQLRKQTLLLDKQQKLLSRQFAKTGATAKAAGIGMGRMFSGLLGIAAIGKVVKTWSNLDESMRRVQGVVKGTTKDMVVLDAQMLSLIHI